MAAYPYACRALVTAFSNILSVSASLLIGFLGSDLHDKDSSDRPWP